MKKTLLFAAMVLVAIGLKSQTNIQELYDFNRGHFTTTVEMFKPDKWGSTFFFTDIYHNNNCSFPTDNYWEISRSLNFWSNSKLAALSAHVEWNGGLGYRNDINFGYGVSNTWLLGVEYFLHSVDFNNTFTFQLLYRHITENVNNGISYIPIQLTFVWGLKNLLGVSGLTFSGYFDVWGNKQQWAGEETNWVVMGEPQLWYNIGQHFGCENLHLGGEVEITYNFSGAYPANYLDRKGLNVAPCLGLKWDF